MNFAKDVDKLPSDSLHFGQSFDFLHNPKTDTDPLCLPASSVMCRLVDPDDPQIKTTPK